MCVYSRIILQNNNKMARLMLVVLVTFFTKQSLAIPMSVQSCTPTEMVRVSLASKLELNCASPCDPKLPQQYEWTKVGEGKHVEQLAIQGQALVISSIGYKDKGTYKCRCLTGETWCEQTVYVRSSLEFFSPQSFVYAQEESAKLICRVNTSTTGKAVFPVIESLRKKEILKTSTRPEGDQSFVSWITLPDTKIPKENFVCSIDIVDKSGQVMEKLKKNLTIYTYTPPEVDQTNHAVISKDKYVGTSCELACIVLASPDVETIVTWHRNKAEIKFPSGKYSTRVEETSEDKTFRYVLKVHDLQLSDIGQYACRVQSQFNMEDQGIASIKFQNEEKDSKPKDDSGQKDDFGKKDDSGQKDDFGKKDDSGQKDGTILKDGTGVGESKEVKFPMKFALVVIIVVGGVFIWKCYKWRMRRSGPYTKESYTHGSSADSGFQNNDMEMFRRKYKHVQ